MLSRAAELYLDLIKRSLLNIPYLDNELRLRYCQHVIAEAIKLQRPPQFAHAELYNVEESRGGIATRAEIDEYAEAGRKVRQLAHVMMGQRRLENIVACMHVIIDEDVPGDVIECGTWKGGGALMMKAVLRVRESEHRRVWLADSFEGVPPSTLPQDKGIDLTAQTLPWIAVSQPRVVDLFRRYGLLDGGVAFLAGWFKDSLPKAPIDRLAVLRIDGDLYESTRDAIRPLYDKVSPGGFVIVDDYGDIAACRLAIDEFRAERGINDKLIPIDWTGVYWRKSG